MTFYITLNSEQKLQAVCISSSSSFEPDVVLCSDSVIPLQHRSCSVCRFLTGWATTTGRLLGPKVETAISVFPKEIAMRYRIESQTEVLQPFDY